jgi:hypothetical protein
VGNRACWVSPRSRTRLSTADKTRGDSLKVKPGQRWHIRISDRKLKYRQIDKHGKPGKWRKVQKQGHHYLIGESSGLPQNLFQPWQEVILAPVMRITRASRTFRKIRKPLRSGLRRAAALIGCRAVEESKTRITFLRHGKRCFDFLIVDFHHHGPEEFYKTDRHSNIVRNPKRMPRRALGKLAQAIRKRERTGLRALEETSPAILRWVIVIFAPSDDEPRNVWLVPARSKGGQDHGRKNVRRQKGDHSSMAATRVIEEETESAAREDYSLEDRAFTD